MKKLVAFSAILLALSVAALAQSPATTIPGKEVFKNDDVVFHQIDAHTWVGTGHQMSNESLYLVEGNARAALIDAGTTIAGLDRIVASLTKKPVTLFVTHAHPDHTGSAISYFPELYIGAGDESSSFVSTYKGKFGQLRDGEVIDLGGRTLEVVATPGHTPGSTTFIDKAAGYGFSGDSFGSGNLLLGGTFSTLLSSCQKTAALMEKTGVKHLYPGHFFGQNFETRQRLEDMAAISRDVLAGKVKGEPNPKGMMGLNLVVSAPGIRINYSEKSVK